MKTTRKPSSAERQSELGLISNFARTRGVKVLPNERAVAHGIEDIPFFLQRKMRPGRKPGGITNAPLSRPEIPPKYIKVKFDP